MLADISPTRSPWEWTISPCVLLFDSKAADVGSAADAGRCIGEFEGTSHVSRDPVHLSNVCWFRLLREERSFSSRGHSGRFQKRLGGGPPEHGTQPEGFLRCSKLESFSAPCRIPKGGQG